MGSAVDMVYLSRIYTGAGDDGSTGLGDGGRVAKDDPRVEAIGDVDELNAVVGLLRSHLDDPHPEAELLAGIGNDLFDVGADLCMPADPSEGAGQALRIADHQVELLERAIDRLNADLAPLRSFVLPGGSPLSAWCHLARTVCRRAERRVVALARVRPINPRIQVYLNRLSDLFFVLARRANQGGAGDVLLRPAQRQADTGGPAGIEGV